MNNRSSADRPIIVFGAGSFASLAAHALTHDAQRQVLGFTVDAAPLRDRLGMTTAG